MWDLECLNDDYPGGQPPWVIHQGGDILCVYVCTNYDNKQEKEDHRNWEEKETEAEKVLSVPQTTQNLWTGLCEVWRQIARRS